MTDPRRTVGHQPAPPSGDHAASRSGRSRVVYLESWHARMLRLIATVVGVAGIASSGVMVAFAHASTEIPQYVVALLPAVAGALIVTIVGMQRRRIRLRLTDDGIEYHAFGAFVRARWEDVVGLAHVEHGPFAGLGVTLHRVVDTPASLACRVWWLLGIRAPERAIPLSPFVGLSRGSWLELELRRRVPTLNDLHG